MTNGRIYALDANVFIEAARRYYAFDLVPIFWQTLENLAQNNHVKSIDRIQTELLRGHDELSRWVTPHFGNAFESTNEPQILQQYGNVMNWVQSQDQFLDYAKSDFAAGADGWLIAYAIVNNYVVVTHEVYNPTIKNKVPIPNVCRNFNVQNVDTFEMLRALSIRFN